MKTLQKKIGRVSHLTAALRWLTATALIATLVLLPPIIEQGTGLDFGVSAFAAPGGGGNGGGGNGGDSGNEPPDYGDLIILYRDAYGVPYPTAMVGEMGLCQQPIPSDTCVTSPPQGCELEAGFPDAPGVLVVPVDPATCAVTAECAPCTQEVEFNRINEARSPASVFEAQLEDVTTTLATAGCISVDPAGRPVASTLSEGIVVTSTIDSPLQNMAIYRQLLSEGTLGENIDSALSDLGVSLLDTAARGIGAASGKDDKLNVDLFAYLNEILELTAQSPTPLLNTSPICEWYREEVMGQMESVQKCFLDYSNFSYNREVNFSGGESVEGLPNPPYIPETLPASGKFEYLAELTLEPLTFHIVQDLIMDAPIPEWSSVPNSANIGGFVQAADDTRAVIEFMHTWPVPGDYPTVVPCDNEGNTFYDVSISDVSGLQVPVRMTAGTWRGGEVTVVNNGPGDASGTIMVERLMNGESFTLYSAEPEEGEELPPPIFEAPEPFDLLAGGSMTWHFYFTIESDIKTTIDWKATAVAVDDVNLDNNVVEEETSVTKSNSAGGGGGH